MTTISANPLPAFSPANVAQAVTGAQFVLAAGVLGRAMNPLNAGPLAFAALPSVWSLALASAARPQQPVAQWTASTGSNGQGSVDLGDGYSLQLNENNSEITIRNAATGETTRIWGDPHVEIDGKHAYDF